MSQNDYTIKDIIEEFRRDTKESLNRIEAQTVKTNGRVDSLENHRSYLWGAYTALVLLGGLIISMSVMAIDSKVVEAVRAELAEYKRVE